MASLSGIASRMTKAAEFVWSIVCSFGGYVTVMVRREKGGVNAELCVGEDACKRVGEGDADRSDEMRK